MKILIATDGSQHAERAASLVSHFVHQDELEITILCVIDVPYLQGSQEVVEWIRKNQKQERVKAELACTRIEGMFQGANAKVRWVTCEAHASQQILQEAGDREIDLIVMGAEGHSAISRLLVGSVSDFVATHAKCSVLVVRPTTVHSNDDQHLRICVAHDESEPSKFAVEQLKKFKWGRSSELQLVSVLNYPYLTLNEAMEVDLEPVRNAMSANLEKIGAELQSIAPVAKSELIESTHIGDAVCRFAEDNESDLIVLGNSGLGMIGRFLLGSVATYVLRHAKASVWIARKPEH